MPLRTHLTAIEDTCRKEPDATAFRIPKLDNDGLVSEWTSISYQQFWSEILAQAQKWSRVFKGKNIARGSVITHWFVRLIATRHHSADTRLSTG